MRVVAKFSLAFFAASCLCLAVYSYLEAVRAVSRLQASVEADLTSLGIGLRDAVSVIWEEHGEQSAERVLRASAGARKDVDITLVRDDAPSGAGETATTTTARGREVRVSVPIRVRDQHGRLVLRRQVPGEGAIIAQALRSQLLFVAALAIVGAALAVTLGGALIGSPLSRIVAQAQRIGAGNFSQRLRADRKDEIGDLKRELNTMCDRLTAAHKRAEEEASARVETLEQLRHLDRLRTVGTIASSIAHELGTPLNVLLLRGQSLASGEVQGEEIVESGQAVLAQVEKMSRIVRQLLDFSRKKNLAARDGSLDLADVALHSCRLLESLARRNGVKLVVDVSAPRPVGVRGDFGQLEQALTNLIVNGIHAMASGGTLKVVVRAGETAEIAVEDTGPGISDDDAHQIFEPFFTTKPDGSGTGLGLSVARGIIEEHGGTLQMETEKGRGTTFTMSFPRSE